MTHLPIIDINGKEINPGDTVKTQQPSGVEGGCYDSEQDISEELSLLDPEEQTEIKEALQNYLQTNPTT